MSIFPTVNSPDLFLPSLRAAGVLLGIGFLIILFFARQNLHGLFQKELGLRFISWIFLIALYLTGIFLGQIWGKAVLFVMIFLALLEFNRAVHLGNRYFFLLVGEGLVSVWVAFRHPELFAAIPALALVLLPVIPLASNQVEGAFEKMAAAYVGFIYIIWSLTHLVLLSWHSYGIGLLILVGFGSAMADVGAYTIGNLLKPGHLIAPNVHPRKAYEGVLGDLLGAALAVWLFQFAIPPNFGPIEIVVLVILIALGSSFGDLTSSLLKRNFGLKDWGYILPGHGGVLDRLNSLIFVTPLVFYFVLLAER